MAETTTSSGDDEPFSGPSARLLDGLVYGNTGAQDGGTASASQSQSTWLKA